MILFGPLGPPQQRTFADGSVRAAIVFQLAQDLRAVSGEDTAGPSVAAGTLTITVGGRRRTYDLASVLPIHEGRIELLADEGCGTGHVLTHARTYLVIQAVLAEKGCAPLASFIDLVSGSIVENVVLDHAWDHRSDKHPSAFAGEALRVTRAEPVILDVANFEGAPPSPQPSQWPFVIVHTLTTTARPHAIAYCTACTYPLPAPGSEKPPTVGSRIRIGNFAAPRDYGTPMFARERVVLLGPADEARYAALQTPTPH